ncbi:hypothetical protein BP6252_13208 [Coleophoma cylindrospora]|uniref:Clr5 domain-containing protein n=1 Tax=Coleophoma cylindrospora TaxID=1849047 RepID=A0A3D8QA59_9HELO|nr:hypothetical protein BP6252_13208 [Coleophoma cylindrospora]
MPAPSSRLPAGRLDWADSGLPKQRLLHGHGNANTTPAPVHWADSGHLHRQLAALAWPTMPRAPSGDLRQPAHEARESFQSVYITASPPQGRSSIKQTTLAIPFIVFAIPSIAYLLSSHKETLYQLYIVEGKPRTVVKEIMEAKCGFPEMRLRDYEVALRDRLGFRKRIKGKDWLVIRHHVMKRRSDMKATNVYLYGQLVLPTTVNREIRRNNSQKQPHVGDYSGCDRKLARPIPQINLPLRSKSPALPTGISLRTPPPSPRLPPSALISTDPHLGIAMSPSSNLLDPSQGFLDTHFSALSHYGVTAPLQNRARVIPSMKLLENSPYQKFLSIILNLSPVNAVDDPVSLLWKTSAFMDQPTHSVLSKNIDPFLPKFSSIIIPNSLGLNPETSGLQHHYFQSSLFDFLMQACHQISNRHRLSNEDLRTLLDWIGISADLHVLRAFFSLQTFTVMAFWENLIDLAGDVKHAKAFVVLIEISFDINNGVWIDNMSTHILTKTVLMGADKATQVVGRLLDTIHTYDLDAVLFRTVLSLDAKMIETLLGAGACLNGTMTLDNSLERLVSDAVRYPRRRVETLAERTNLIHCIQILLEAGANLDNKRDHAHAEDEGPIQYELAHSVGWCSVCEPFWLADELWFRWLEHWDLDDDLFRLLTRWSRRFKESATVPGIVMAARGGVEDLQTYLAPRLEPQGLERQVLFEIALSVAAQAKARAAVVCLAHFGVDPNVIELDKDSRRLWNPVISATPDIDMLQSLKDAGADLNLANALAQTCYGASPAARLDTIRWLIENGADLTEYGQQAIIEICGKEDDLAVVEMLVAGGTPLGGFLEHKKFSEDCERCESTCSDECEGMDILQLAIRHKCSLQVVQLLIQQSLAVTSIPHTCDGRTMLHDALLNHMFPNERPGIVALLLEHGADIKAFDGGLTILEAVLPYDITWLGDNDGMWDNNMIAAAKKQSVDLFRQLLDAGASLVSPPKRAKAKKWTTALVGLMKCEANDSFIHQVIDQYLAADGDIDQQGDSDDTTLGYLTLAPLQSAASYNRVSVAKYLIERGADINAPAHHTYGMTALQAACDSLAEEIDMDFIKLLISREANVNAPASTEQLTALSYAAYAGSLTLACLLLDHGADPNITCRPYRGFAWNQADFPSKIARPLDFAAAAGRLDMVQLLRDAGGISGAPGQSGFDAAISIARGGAYMAIVELLQQSPPFASA